MLVDAVQLTTVTFAALHPNQEHFLGVTHDRRQHCAYVKNDVAKIGDWIVRDTFGNLSVCSAALFDREYKKVGSNVIPFRR